MGALLVATAVMTVPATAQAGYVHVVVSDGTGWVTFEPLPTDSPDLRIQVLDGGETVIVEDRNAPITPGLPPTASPDAGFACDIVSAHVARCSSPTIFSFQTDLSLNGAATIRDLPGSGQLIYWIETGRAGDTIDLRHGGRYDVRDLGGLNNSIALGPGGDSYVRLGPGKSTVDVANGLFDRVDCLRTKYVPLGIASVPGVDDQPELGVGEYNVLDSVSADPFDRMVDCD